MVAAQDIYIQTGDEKYIDQLLKKWCLDSS